MNIRSDINARTAMVYGGAAFLLMIVGFRSIFATWDPDHVGIMTYLSISALVLEFFLLLLYAQSIYNLVQTVEVKKEQQRFLQMLPAWIVKRFLNSPRQLYKLLKWEKGCQI